MKASDLRNPTSRLLEPELEDLAWIRYGCDFNRQIGRPPLHAQRPSSARRCLSGLHADDLAGMPIALADHRHGCTAGRRSSRRGSRATSVSVLPLVGGGGESIRPSTRVDPYCPSGSVL